ncbi:MAG TPA: chemotaxis protein CheA [Geobacteraceae bacterium]|nr:chemotaxis protein CheA [Geobacteraceae bacterium]
MDMSQYRELFISEAREHLRSMNELIVHLEKEPGNPEKIDSLFRSAHSIKGMAASMAFADMTELAHKAEDLMDRVRKGELAFDGGVADLLLSGTDQLEAMILDVEQGGTGSSDITGIAQKIAGYTPAAPLPEALAPSPEEEARPSTGQDKKEEARKRLRDLRQTVRVKTEILDRLINTTGELLTNKHRLIDIGRELDSTTLNAALMDLSRLLRELHNEVMKVRMMPFSAVSDRFPRLIRDLAKKSGKEVAFSIEGEEAELDRGILEELADPLIHIIRNAVDHGLETPAERVAGDKPAKGSIRLSVRREKDLMFIEVADDGRGMDPAALTAAAIEKGFIDPEKGKELSARDALAMICVPGFSTASVVTDVSGRGVGMDSVSTTMKSLSGSLVIESEPGRGSRFILKLPLTITIINVLLARVSSFSVAIPVSSILHTLELKREMLFTLGKNKAFYLEGQAIPVMSLGQLFSVPYAPVNPEYVSLFIADIGGRLVGITVDRFLGQREVFVKPLGRPLAKMKGLAGGSILGDGEIVFILDVTNLL